MRQKQAHGGRAAHQRDLGKEQRFSIEFHAVRHPDKTDHRTWASTSQRLRHRFLRAHAFEDNLERALGLNPLINGDDTRD